MSPVLQELKENQNLMDVDEEQIEMERVEKRKRKKKERHDDVNEEVETEIVEKLKRKKKERHDDLDQEEIEMEGVEKRKRKKKERHNDVDQEEIEMEGVEKRKRKKKERHNDVDQEEIEMERVEKRKRKKKERHNGVDEEKVELERVEIRKSKKKERHDNRNSEMKKVDKLPVSTIAIKKNKKQKNPKIVVTAVSEEQEEIVNKEQLEKRKRRKLERHARRDARRIKAGKLPLNTKVDLKKFATIWARENAFITNLSKCLPEVKQPYLKQYQEEKIDEYLLDEDDNKDKEEKKRKQFLEKTMKNCPQTSRATSHQELKDRLHAKMAEKRQQRNEKKHLQKLKKIARTPSDETPDVKSKKGKQFISQLNPNIGNQNQPDKSGRKPTTVKTGESTETAIQSSASSTVKTPLRKKPVVKSDGQVVYSKFDFISEDRRDKSANSKGKPKPTDLLKSAERNESKIARLETQGKKVEAASVAENQKWSTALKRAQGEKIRDDPHLLKKTIKKQEKTKQASRKKWDERKERVEQQQEMKQDKRKTNIQARKDSNKKKTLKIQRIKGRIL